MVRKVCTRIAVMYLGEMVEIADNHHLFFDPQHPYTKALLSEPRRWSRSRLIPPTSCGGRAAQPDRHPGRCSFASRCPKAFGRCGWRRRRWSSIRPGALPPAIFSMAIRRRRQPRDGAENS